MECVKSKYCLYMHYDEHPSKMRIGHTEEIFLTQNVLICSHPTAKYGCGGNGGLLSSPGGSGVFDGSKVDSFPEQKEGGNLEVGIGGKGGWFWAPGGTGHYGSEKPDTKSTQIKL